MRSRRPRWTATASVLLLVFMPAAYSGVITFDEALTPPLTPGYGPDATYPGMTPKGTAVSAQYLSWGVLISVVGSGANFVSDVSYVPSGAPATGRFLTLNTTPLGWYSPATLVVTFVKPSDAGTPGFVAGSSIRFLLEDTETGVDVETRDILGNVIETRLLTQYWDVLSFSSGPVHSIHFIDTGGDGHILDDLQFGEIYWIPEPATFALLAAGLTCLAVLARRKRVI